MSQSNENTTGEAERPEQANDANPNDSRTHPEPNVRLETAEGELVVEGGIPAFHRSPDVLMWGERVFKLYDVDTQPVNSPVVYRECFAVYLSIQIDSKPPEG